VLEMGMLIPAGHYFLKRQLSSQEKEGRRF